MSHIQIILYFHIALACFVLKTIMNTYKHTSSQIAMNFILCKIYSEKSNMLNPGKGMLILKIFSAFHLIKNSFRKFLDKPSEIF